MIYLFLLASGNSVRFGANKLLFDFNGKALWQYGYKVLSNVSKQNGAKLFVISQYKEILSKVGDAGVYCSESQNGLSFTIRAGLSACGEIKNTDKLLFAAADQPYISAESVKKLLDIPLDCEQLGNGSLIARAFDGENYGNPVVFSGILADDLSCLYGEQGGKTVIKRYESRVTDVLIPSNELHDIDTVNDI